MLNSSSRMPFVLPWDFEHILDVEGLIPQFQKADVFLFCLMKESSI